MLFGDQLSGEVGIVVAVSFFELGRGLFKARTIESRSTAAGDHVDHAGGYRVLDAIEEFVESEGAVDLAFFVPGSMRNKLERDGALVVVDMTRERQIDTAFFKNRLEQAHLLFQI